VGTRNCSEYVIRVAKKITTELAQSGFNIISGMAYGIDRCVHQACIDSNGITGAVLAQSPHKPYPDNLYYLYNKIIEKGCVMSQYFDDQKYAPGLFASRNRIISGISTGTVVIEAGEKSGALITASCALDQGREVFAVPFDIFVKNKGGTNNLIKKGEAKLITSANDILEEFGMSVRPSPKIIHDLNTKQKEIMSILFESSLSVEDLSKRINLNINQTLINLTDLEIKGIVRKFMEKYEII